MEKTPKTLIVHNTGAGGAVHDVLNSWTTGAQAYGDTVKTWRESEQLFGDFLLSWGTKQLPDNAHGCCAQQLITELGFLGNRTANHFFFGAGGLNGRGALPGDVIPCRGSQWYGDLEPRKSPDRHKRVVILGQIPRDSSLEPLGRDQATRPDTYGRWVMGMIRTCWANDVEEILWRPHPKDPVWSGAYYAAHFEKLGVKIREDLSNWEVWEWADLAIAYSSNALVEAFMAGVDVLPGHHTSLTYGVRSDFHQSRRVPFVRQKQWLDWVATHQWSIEEIRRGDAWAYLRNAVEA